MTEVTVPIPFETAKTALHVSADDVVASYRSKDRSNPRQDVINMIRLYPNWQRRVIWPTELLNLTWYLDPDPKHVSWKLTQGGTKRSLGEVARQYLALGVDELREDWPNVDKIERIIESMKKGVKEEPIIVVEGEKYPNSPESSFIDGVHRSLAATVYYLETKDDNVGLEAFVGRKAGILSRITRKLSLGSAKGKTNY